MTIIWTIGRTGDVKIAVSPVHGGGAREAVHYDEP